MSTLTLQIKIACQILEAGGVITYPTEAVWGLGCDPENEFAVQRLLTIKSRPLEKGLILVAASMKQLAPLTKNLEPDQIAALTQSWPGPVTWLIPDPQRIVPAWITGDHSTVAVRVSAHPIVQALCTKFRGPIVSTSANVAGKDEIRSSIAIVKKFASKVDFIVNGALGQESQPSQIRDLVSGATLR